MLLRMKLGAWLDLTGTTEAAFAEKVGVSEAQINRIKHGVRMPSLDLAARIQAATDNAVTPNDFVSDPPARPRAKGRARGERAA